MGNASQAGLAVGVDVGGTKVAAGLVGADGSVIERLRRETPAQDPERSLPALVAGVVAELGERCGVGALPVGVGAAGLVDLDGTVRYAPNIDWADFPLRAALAERLDGPVTVDNDANVAAWGEYRAGAGAAAPTAMVMLTLGTGVGGGLVLGDRLVRGGGGLAAEFGHVVVKEGGPRCPCGNRGCLEPLASGTAIGRLARDGLADGSAPQDTSLRRLPAEQVTGKTVTMAAHAGDRYATGVLARCGFWLGVGVASLVNALDPEVVVVGGGAMQAGELILAPAREAAAERVLGREHRRLPPIVRASLGDDAGIVGAALLALAAGGDR
ncbi:MAG: ROK family protein [Euzebyales bacterium]|nr:ROK family protein [Euzebyales bacterium]